MKKEIVMASTNRDKIAEVEEILTEYQVQTLQELGITVEVEEDQETFEANARKKAETIAHAVGGKMCIADDTGIEIEALNGFPGVRTKRWYPGNDAERNQKILEKLAGLPKEERKIRWVTAIALSNGETTISTTQALAGYVAKEARGNNSFGFSEIFELENGRTLSEISKEEFAALSIRRSRFFAYSSWKPFKNSLYSSNT